VSNPTARTRPPSPWSSSSPNRPDLEAAATGLDPDEHLTGARLRHGDVLDAQRLGEVMNDGGLCDHERLMRSGVEVRGVEGGAVRDMEVWPSVAALQGEAANHRKLRRSRAGVVSVAETARRERVRCDLRRRT
jgi:hypothetical protein